MAHIRGKSPDPNRYNKDQDSEEWDDYQKLILLCPNHHTEIDKPENENTYSVEWVMNERFGHE